MEKENKSVWSQEKEIQEEISEVTEENVSEADKISEVTEEKIDVTEEKPEEVGVEVEETVQEEVLVEDKKLNKHDEAKALVEEARDIVQNAEKQLEECKLLLSDDLQDYEKAKQALKEGGLDESETLLAELGYIDNSTEEKVEDTVVFEPKEDLEPIIIRDVSSGKFTGFVMALIGGVASAAGMIYVAISKLGVTLDVSKVPTVDTIKPIFSWYGSLVGMKDNVFVGGALVLLVALLVMWIIYAIRVSSKASKNLEFAKQQLEEAEAYRAHKGNCKEEMDKVDAHIHNAIETLKTYQVLINEQKGKLQRILYIEEKKEDPSEYHEKSISEMKHTQELINAIRNFMAAAMSEEGKLSGKSTLFLHSAKSKMQKMIDRLY
jgi:hypothetical protein